MKRARTGFNTNSASSAGLQKHQHRERDLQLGQPGTQLRRQRLGEQSPHILGTGNRHHADEPEGARSPSGRRTVAAHVAARFHQPIALKQDRARMAHRIIVRIQALDVVTEATQFLEHFI